MEATCNAVLIKNITTLYVANYFNNTQLIQFTIVRYIYYVTSRFFFIKPISFVMSICESWNKKKKPLSYPHVIYGTFKNIMRMKYREVQQI